MLGRLRRAAAVLFATRKDSLRFKVSDPETVRWSPTGYMSNLGIYEFNPDDIVMTKGSGSYSVYKDMMTDPVIATASLRQKINAIADLAVTSAMPGDTRSDADAAYVKYVFKQQLNRPEEALLNIGEIALGMTINEVVRAEILHGEYTGKIGIDHFKSLDPDWYTPRLELDGNISGWWEDTTGSHSVSGKLISSSDIIHFTWLSKYGNPYGTADLRTVYKYWWIKDSLLKLWATYAERYASGVNVAEISEESGITSSESPEYKAIQRALNYISSNTHMTLPPGVTVKNIVTAAPGAKEAFKELFDVCDKQIALGIQGATRNILESKFGSRADSETAKEEANMKPWLIRKSTEHVLNDSVIPRLIDINFGMPSHGYPKITLHSIEEKNPTLRLEQVKEAREGGQPLVSSEYYEAIGFSQPKDDDDVVTAVRPNPKPDDISPDNISPEEKKPSKFNQQKIEFVAAKPLTFEPFDRPLTQFEQSFDVRKTGASLDAMVAAGRVKAAPAYYDIEKSVLRQVKKLGLFQHRNKIGDIHKVAINPIKLRRAYNGTLLAVTIQARYDAMEQMRRDGYAKIKFAKTISRMDAKDIIEHVSIEADISTEEERQMLLGLSRKGMFTDKEVKTLVQYLKQEATYVAGMEKSTIDKDVQGLLAEFMHGGASEDGFARGLNDMMTKYADPVYVSRDKDGKPLPGAIARADKNDNILDYHARLVFRMASNKVYNAAIVDTFTSDEALGLYPGLQFSEIRDTRTSYVSKKVDQLVILANGIYLARYSYPLHYGDRGGFVGVNAVDFNRSMLSPPPTVRLPAGFGGRLP